MLSKQVNKMKMAQNLLNIQSRSKSVHLSKFATMDPKNLVSSHKCMNLVAGNWIGTEKYKAVIDPLTGKDMVSIPDTSTTEAEPFIESLRNTPKFGLHNPLHNKERYLMLGDVTRKAAEVLHDPEVFEHMIRLVQRSVPKSYSQTEAEVRVTRQFFENFGGDQVRFLAESKTIPGDHKGQSTQGYRWPFGGVGIITPFNFPIEIPVLQFMGALYMGNKPVLKGDSRTSFPLEEWIRMLHYCGLPKEDMDFLHADGDVMERILVRGNARNTLFTGSSYVGEHLVKKLNGKVRLEDGGYDWKILGPDVPKSQSDIDYVAWQCDHDSFGHSGQKCSAQSILFMHKNWRKTDVIDKWMEQTAKRNLKDLTIGPVLSWDNEDIKGHIDDVLQMDGTEILIGGKPLEDHTIPDIYGSYEPTVIKVPLKHFRAKKKRDILTTELFGPFTIVVEYFDKDLEYILETINDLPHHLTAAVVSNDVHFNDKVLGQTLNGTQYAGLRARTTGAPQNHWFGPCGDPRGAGIGTPYAIQTTWSHHREIVHDIGPIPDAWTMPPPA